MSSDDDREIQADISETTYFTCLRYLSQTLGKCQWEKYQFTELKGKEKVEDKELDYVLNTRPNPYMSAITFWQTVELNRNHHGNAYVYIERDGIKVKKLWILPSDEVQVWIDNKGYFGIENGLWYVWDDSRSGKQYSFLKDDILHFKTHMSWDGLIGIPVREILKTQLFMKKKATNFLNRIYSNSNIGSKMIVRYTGELNEEKAKNMINKIASFAKAKDTGAFIPMPLGYEVQLLNLKLADNQFLENLKNIDLLIAAAFGIKPNVINDYTKSSYSNSETQQLDFYVNTLHSISEVYEQELTWKILSPKLLNNGFRIRMNEDILFKMDNQTKSNVYIKYLQNFIMTPNEVREALNLPYVEGGDKLIGNGNSISLKKIGTQY